MKQKDATEELGDIGEDDEEINLEEILKELEDESAELESDEDESSEEIAELEICKRKEASKRK